MRKPATATRRFRVLGPALLAAVGLEAGGATPPVLSITVLDGPCEVLKAVELAIEGVPAGANPFDPDAIAVDLEAVPPAGAPIRLPAFWFQDFERSLAGNREKLAPRGEAGWRARYVPLVPGRHALTVSVAVAGQPAGRGESTIDAAPAARPGFARVEERGKRYFRLDDGTPLFLKGLCACWHGSRGSYDYDDWLAAYRENGINYIRLWMWPEAFGIEWDRGDRLRYRLDRAWVLDRVLAEARARGVYVMLCFDYHGMFEEKPDYWGGNNRWPRHPYNAANGGPCADQNEFMTRPEARELYAKRLRYIVGRWTAFTNILAWEFFNEIDNVYKYLKHDDVVAWHRDMARRLRALDPYRHLITSSFTGCSDRGGLFELPEMDFSQYHSYNEKHPAVMTARRTAEFFARDGKPFFVSEYGTDWRGWKPDQDPYLRALHQAVWSGAFTGAAGTGMTWWWESIHSQNLYRHWSALAAFLEGTAIGDAAMKPIVFQESAKARAFGVAAPRRALVWLLDSAYDWPNGAMDEDPAPCTGAAAVFTGLADGAYRVEWWDTAAGKPVLTEEARVAGGRLALAPPPFRLDIAARIEPR
ncbi:MAG TPA: cellulase family glycosylhydrolase [Planctomycetota bacterium]|jgi:hypothetical protein|nr:cellulase family glycosylhydrolase [Planctomycetota bacterium]OQC20398.1 MAG: Sugar-binding cellulase-like protein [Planctomycetes bacterium ADurb.Bin069]NMD34431.1 cellulase family glycosylhydrolase [Planctomycetota bacterium]HNR98616.1 cellulase family glycosylhydrolase [Planctomycetota bacterium]HNU24996.1 cellulase family glycosylhydrolase [Planctomycetota bacterium]